MPLSIDNFTKMLVRSSISSGSADSVLGLLIKEVKGRFVAPKEKESSKSPQNMTKVPRRNSSISISDEYLRYEGMRA